MKQLLTGNEAVARGAWEAGVLFASAYPGTPSTEILEGLSRYPDVISEWAPNEKVAVEAAIGASFAGARALAAMKQVGVNVAADPIFTCAYTGVNGGLVIVAADDPNIHSSQNEQDSRHYARAAKLPMLEPADSQEAKDMVREALRLSERFCTPVLLRMTTRVCHSKSIVELADAREDHPIIPYEKKDRFSLVPLNSLELHAELERRLDALSRESDDSGLNFEIWGSRKVGIIAAGAAYQYAREVFGDGASYLKLGMTYPMPLARAAAFASQVEELYVVEELEPFMEHELRAYGVKCIGKDKLPLVGELDPDVVRRSLLGIAPPEAPLACEIAVPRAPVLCAGCPHRGFFHEAGKLKDAVIIGDIGCYVLGEKDILICMGGGFSIAHGAQKIFDREGSGRRCVGIMGDSTFFHSGMTSMLEVAYNRSNALLVVLDNRATGMTGHQDHPGTGRTLSGEQTFMADIGAIASALGIAHVRTVDPLDLTATRDALSWGMDLDEPAVLIMRRPCALKKMTQAELDEFGSRGAAFCVDEESCIGCRACIDTGCPALEYRSETLKASIRSAHCAGCGTCAQVCPVDAIARIGS